jgi:hypothetical protein
MTDLKDSKGKTMKKEMLIDSFFNSHGKESISNKMVFQAGDKNATAYYNDKEIDIAIHNMMFDYYRIITKDEEDYLITDKKEAQTIKVEIEE